MKNKFRIRMYRILSFILCLGMLLPAFGGLIFYADETPIITPGIRKADGDTTKSYADLIDLRDESRRAGRVWADKSVFTGSYVLDDGTIVTNLSDFLHVFSALGSSQKIDKIHPLDVVFILDTSASMSSQGENQFLQNGSIVHKDANGRVVATNNNPRLEYTTDALNRAFELLLESEGCEYNRVALVTFNLGAQEVLPLGRYSPTTVNRTASQSGGYHNGEDRYFTIAQASNNREGRTGVRTNSTGVVIPANAKWQPDPAGKGNDWLLAPVKNNDNRFLQQYTDPDNNERFIDSNGTVDDWKIIEINAVDEKSKNSSVIIVSSDTYGLYRSTTKGSDGLGIPYLHTSAGTDTYWGILKGMQILATAKDTTLTLYKNSDGTLTETRTANATAEFEIQRQPIVVLLTDGAPNPNSTGSKGYARNWWTGTNNAGESNTTKSELTRYDSANGLLVAATAAYQKQLVEQNYYGKIPTSKEEYNTLVYNFGICMDNPDDSGGNSNTAHDGQVALAGLNPASLYAKEENGTNYIYNYTYFQTIRTWWEAYLKKNGSVTLSSEVNALPNAYTMKHPSANDITSLDYPSGYQNIDNPDRLPEELETLIKSFMSEIFNPVHGENDVDVGVDDTLTYMDLIGKYMEVKGVQSIWLFGKLYSIKADETATYYDANGTEITDQTAIKQGRYAYSIRYYRIVDKDGNPSDEVITNYAYGTLSDKKFKLSDIKIYVKDTGYFRDTSTEGGGIQSDTSSEQSLYIVIPSEALPMQVATITLGADDEFINYFANIDSEYATPLRVFYDVGVVDRIKDIKGKIDLTKVSADYLQANRNEETGEVYFYSNWYNSENNYGDYTTDQDGYTFGDPVLSFSPSDNNRYYVFQKPLLLYSNPEGDKTGAVVKEAPDGKLSLENGATLGEPVNEIDPDKWYYILIEYYHKDKGLVRYALPRLGSEFGSGVGGNSDDEYLCWYDPATGDTVDYIDANGDVTDNPGGYVLAAKEGGLRVGDMSAGIGQKKDEENELKNATETSDTYYLPTVSSSTTGGDVIINIYLGNNGQLAVADNRILVTKTVNDIFARKDQKFNYEIILKSTTDISGEYNAIKVVKVGDEWRALFDTIELLTNNQGLLMGSDGMLATYDDNGVEYYIYVGDDDAGSSFTHMLFDSDDGKKQLSFTNNTDLTVDEAYLLPVDSYSIDWTFTASDLTLVENFPVGTVDPTQPVGYEFSSLYQSNVTYLTETLDFYYSDEDNEYKAEFTLMHGQGLLFTGLDSATHYTVTEILTDEQRENYVWLKEVDHNGNLTSYFFDQRQDANYTFSGYTDAEMKYVHYYNSVAAALLEISKEIANDPSNNNQDDFTFDIKLTASDGSPVTGKYYYYIHPTNHGCNPEVHESELKPVEKDGVSGETEITIKAGETCVLLGLPESGWFTIEEIFPETNSYLYSSKPNVEVTNGRNVEITETKVTGQLNEMDQTTGEVTAVLVHYENYTLELPSTGGSGVWLFYLLGTALITCTAPYILLTGKMKAVAQR